MENSKKRNLIIIAACVLLLLIVAALFIFDVFGLRARATYVPGNYPEGVSFAEVDTGDELSDKERYDAYSAESDPAHPVLDTKVSLYISNLGSKPGEPRPQDIASEYPSATPLPTASPKPTPNPSPSVTLNPNGVLPNVKPSVVLPNVTMPELYIVNPDVKNPQFIGQKYTLEWKYTAGREVTFTVLSSSDGGRTFDKIAEGISDQNYTITFPAEPVERCMLRVQAMLDGRIYKRADTAEFALAEAPEPTPKIIVDYVDEQVQYTDMPGMRISSEAVQSVWFKAESLAEDASKLVWQLSKTPFWGTKESFGSENGIIASGELDSTQNGEFSLDLKALCDKLINNGGSTDSEQPFLIEQSIYPFYMRVVALDENGDCIGDPGQGLEFTYGVPDIVPNLNSTAYAEDSKIEILANLPYYWEYKWQRVSPGVLNRDLNSTPDMLLFSGMDGSTEGSDIIQKAVQVELQVTTSPFTSVGVAKPEGLVYSYLDTAPDIGESLEGYNYSTPWFHGIEYEQFVPSEAELDAMGGLYYYVRAIFYVPDSENPSILRPMPSETMTIAFRVTSAKNNEVKKVTVKSNIPFVQFLSYNPVKWQAPDYDEYFEVTRHIEAEEMNFYIKNYKTGDFLLPYPLHIATYHWTREQYQAKLDEMLPVGASFHYVKSEPGFWDEFFGLLKSIYSAVQKAYADAKNAVVSMVDYVPLIGDTAKGYLKQAVRYTIDYGLASIGLPPSLPNLDKLAAGGLDYCFKVAVDEALKAAGVPADSAAAQEITEKVRKQLTDGMTQELRNALIAQQQNPFRADFIRLYTEKLYEPAYIDVLVANYSDEDTIGGKLGVGFEKSFAVYSSQVLTIPTLKPGESVVVRIYLDHLRNKYDGYNKYFDEIYNGNSEKPFTMSVYTVFNLPDVVQAAKDQGLQAAPLPAVTEYVYDHSNYVFTREFVPKDPIAEADGAVKASDFGK